jgi:hypothetical protein
VAAADCIEQYDVDDETAELDEEQHDERDDKDIDEEQEEEVLCTMRQSGW